MPDSSATSAKFSSSLPRLIVDLKTRPFVLNAKIEFVQHATLDAFSLFGRENDGIGDSRDCLIVSLFMKTISPFVVIAAAYKEPPKSAAGS